MKSKSLETMLARYSGLHSDMVTRFQKLRDGGLLSNSRGRNAEYLTLNEVAAGILSVVAERPGYAAMTAVGLGGLRPVGVPEDAFGGAPTLNLAIVRALEDDTLRSTLVEMRLGDSDPEAHNSTTAAIVYSDGERILTSYYVHETALSQFRKGMQKTFNRPAMGKFSIRRETCIARPLLDSVARAIREAQEMRELDERLQHHISA